MSAAVKQFVNFYLYMLADDDFMKGVTALMKMRMNDDMLSKRECI